MLLLAATAICANVMAQLPIKRITKNVTTNTTWHANQIYFLKNKIYVTNNATLTIEPGTVIQGDTTNKGSLIITRGAKIQAVGTPCSPIVFTSSKAPNRRNRGDWGGLILLGYAQINPPGDTAHIEGITPIPETLFGGGLNPNCGGGDCPDNADNSGTLQYVRVEFAGVALAPNNEINGLTMGGVGSGTTIDHVQVSYSNDDSYEWFGGTVNTKYLVAFRGLDDEFDTDNGYSGKNQFLFSLRDPAVADISGSNGFESDNDAAGSSNTPLTRAVFSNVTIDAGSDSATNLNFRRSAHIRRTSHEYVYNSILMGFPTGVLIDGSGTEANVLADTMFADNIVAATRSVNWESTTPVNASVDNLLRNNAGNSFYTGNAGVKLTTPYSLTNPKPWPKSTSPALGAANFNHAVLNDAFFTPVTYAGAFAQGAGNSWMTTWTNWTPVKTDYSNGSNQCAKTFTVVEQPIADVTTVDALISPNPSKGSFNVVLKGFNTSSVNVRVADLNTGKVYFTGKAANNSTTKISIQVPNGNYVVELTDGKNVISRKVSILN
jgi:hypothetical protein